MLGEKVSEIRGNSLELLEGAQDYMSKPVAEAWVCVHVPCAITAHILCAPACQLGQVLYALWWEGLAE